MMIYPQYFSIDKNSISIDLPELWQRLGVPKGFDVSAFESIISVCLKKIQPACCYVNVPLSVENDFISLGFVTIKSTDLAKNLSDCKEAFVFASTLGHTIDRHLLSLSQLSPADFFVADAVCSAIAEKVCDVAQAKLLSGRKNKPRFSPGYGDFDISLQKDVLSALAAQKLLGITLTDSFLMLPRKSITAVVGVL